MLKPNGADRICSGVETNTLCGAWEDIFSWLHGADPDELRHADLVSEVARKAALRMVRFSEYNIAEWARQAKGRAGMRRHLREDTSVQLVDLCHETFSELGLKRDGFYRGWLNRVAIEIIYGTSPQHQLHRDVLVHLLLQRPVIIESWHGHRAELAHAFKLLVRRALCPAPMSNMVHLAIVGVEEISLLSRSLTWHFPEPERSSAT